MSEAGKRLSANINEQCLLIEKAELINYSGPGLAVRAGGSTSYMKKYQAVRQLGEGSLKKYTTNLKYVNALTKAQNSKNFFEISTAEEAQLAHYAAVTIVTKPSKGKSKSKPVFTTSSYKDGIDSDIFKATGQRIGAGLVSLDITHEGVDSATLKMGLVNAKFIFQDIRTMLSEPYVGLFKVGAKDTTAKGTMFRSVMFELGWKSNDDLAEKLNLTNLKLKLKTHLVMYNFDLNQDG